MTRSHARLVTILHKILEDLTVEDILFKYDCTNLPPRPDASCLNMGSFFAKLKEKMLVSRYLELVHTPLQMLSRYSLKPLCNHFLGK